MEKDQNAMSIRHIALLGNYLPRRCGIATFTTDLTSAISEEFAGIESSVVAMNDAGKKHAYSPKVRFEIQESDLASYRRAADFLNLSGVDVLSLQHEYGIFGGKAGSHILALLRDLRMPIVTTLHTILGEPSTEQRRAMDEIGRLSSRVVVMSPYGKTLLQQVHGIPSDKIDLIPHGIPTFPNAGVSKRQLGLEGKTVILTFGLLSPDKGIEYAIESLSSVVSRHPNVVYVVLGATHPHVKEAHGEAYRNRLEMLAIKLGVEANLIFHDRFVSLRELTDFLSAADIYITPYLNPEQITSGTLAYAVGAGKATISTPYRYARELLDEGRGVLVPFKDAAAIGQTLCDLLDRPDELKALGDRAAAYGHDMVWPAVARRYAQSMERAVQEHDSLRRTGFEARTLAQRPMDLPELTVKHLKVMTDDTGLLQHAVFSIPRYEDGYCLDDNARALLLMALVEEAGTEDLVTVRALAARYLAFVVHAFNRPLSRFRNFMTYPRRWTEERGSEDSHGRALWALGAMVGRSSESSRRTLSRDLFHDAVSSAVGFTSPRGWALTLLGVDEYLRAFQGESGIEALQRSLSDRLLALFQSYSTPDWPWFEEAATYDNARLPQALIVSGHRMGDRDMVDAGLHGLEWLVGAQRTKEGHFDPIGSNGFFKKSSDRARFDQQPLEACAMVSACLDAWRVTGDERWSREMRRAFRWFVGENQLQVSLYDPVTGGCRDGLHADRRNENQGAESTLSFLLALNDMGIRETELRLRGESIPPGTNATARA